MWRCLAGNKALFDDYSQLLKLERNLPIWCKLGIWQFNTHSPLLKVTWLTHGKTR